MKNLPTWADRRYNRISMVTTCMGRLCHLRETLIRNIEDNLSYPNIEFVLLDYNSADGLEEWVRRRCRKFISDGVLVYYKTTDPKFFHMSHSKNMVHLLATGDILASVDADNLIGAGYADNLNNAFSDNPRQFCRCSRSGDNGSGGRIAIRRKDFLAIGGYEESMLGWGYEDADLALRSRRYKLAAGSTHAFFCRAVQHDDAMRERHHTPPGTSHIRKEDSIRRNHEILEANRKSKSYVANRDRIWGRGRAIRNWTEIVVTGAGTVDQETGKVPAIEEFEPSKLEEIRHVSPTVAKPIVETHSNPRMPPALPSAKMAGKFIVSRRAAHQANEQV